jgi:hypothetical protein
MRSAGVQLSRFRSGVAFWGVPESWRTRPGAVCDGGSLGAVFIYPIRARKTDWREGLPLIGWSPFCEPQEYA